jgi:hypothetical protein
VNSNRTAAAPTNAWTRFWFTPIAPLGLRCLRFLAGLLFFVWLASFLGHQVELFSMNGWMDLRAIGEVRRLTQDAEQRGEPSPAPPIGWSILFWAGDNVQAFQAIYFGSLAVFALFALGVATRITAPLTWVIVVSFLANPAISYEGDYLLGILAFYLMIGHLIVGQWSGNLSPLERLLGSRNDFVFAAWLFSGQRGEQPPSHGANLMMRLVQIHFTIILLASALHKLQIAEWWGGVALWYPLHPTFKTTLEGLKTEAPNAQSTLFFLSLIQYGVLAWQLGFPCYAWRSGWWRGVLLGGAAIGWAATFFLYQLPTFGPFVMLCCLSFLRPEEWSWALDRAKSLVSNAAVSKKSAEPKKVAVTNIKK